MRQRVGIDHVRVDLHIQRKDRSGAAGDIANRDVEHEDRQPGKCSSPTIFFTKVAFGHNDIEAGHHQDNEQPVVEVAEEKFVSDPCSPLLVADDGGAGGEGIVDRDHNAGHGDPDSGFDQQDSVMLPVRGVMWVEGRIVEVSEPAHETEQSGSRIKQQPKCDQFVDQPRRKDALDLVEAEHHAVKDEGNGDDHTRLEPAAGREISVELNVEGRTG